MRRKSDQYLNRKSRGLLHNKATKLKLKNGYPLDREGQNGDRTVRRIGDGVVEFLKDKEKWIRMSVSDDALATLSEVDVANSSNTAVIFSSTGTGTGTSTGTGSISQEITAGTGVLVTGENPMTGSGSTNISLNGSDGGFDGDVMQIGTATSGLLNLAASKTVRSSFDDVDTILAKLAPPKPPDLSSVSGSLSIGTTYTAQK